MEDNIDLQQDLLAEKDLDLDKCLRIGHIERNSKRSQNTRNTTSLQAVDKLSAYKRGLKRIKIQMEQWSELSNKSSDLPSKAKLTKAVGVAATGASVFCAGINIMRRMGVEEQQLCPTTTIIRVAKQIKLDVLHRHVVGHPERQIIQA